MTLSATKYNLDGLRVTIGLFSAALLALVVNVSFLGEFWGFGVVIGGFISLVAVSLFAAPVLLWLKNIGQFKAPYIILYAGLLTFLGSLLLFGASEKSMLLLVGEFFLGLLAGCVFWLIAVGIRYEPESITSNKSSKSTPKVGAI